MIWLAIFLIIVMLQIASKHGKAIVRIKQLERYVDGLELELNMLKEEAFLNSGADIDEMLKNISDRCKK